jgi:hypothetical protein
VQVTAGFDRVTGRGCALFDPRGTVAPKLVSAFVQLGRDETRKCSENALIVTLDEPHPPAIGNDERSLGYFMILLRFKRRWTIERLCARALSRNATRALERPPAFVFESVTPEKAQ